jgi:hypothetical protein
MCAAADRSALAGVYTENGEFGSTVRFGARGLPSPSEVLAIVEWAPNPGNDASWRAEGDWVK